MLSNKSLITLFFFLFVFILLRVFQIDFVIQNTNYALYSILAIFCFCIFLNIKFRKNKTLIFYALCVINTFICAYLFLKIYQMHFYLENLLVGKNIIILWLIFFYLYIVNNIYITLVFCGILLIISFLSNFHIFYHLLQYIIDNKKRHLFIFAVLVIIYLFLQKYLNKYYLKNNNILPALKLLNKSSYKILKNKDISDEIVKFFHNFSIQCCRNNCIPGPVVSNYYLMYKNDLSINHLEVIIEELQHYLNMSIIFSFQAHKNLILIQIPNKNISAIHLMDIINYKSFSLPLFLGINNLGKIIIYDFISVKNFCINGGNESSKISLLKVIITGLLMTKSPKEVEIIIISHDDTLDIYSSSKHMVKSILKNIEETMSVLKILIKEMEYRYKILSENNMSFETYKQYYELPYIILFVNNFEYFSNKDINFTKIFHQLIEMSHAVGIYTVFTIKNASIREINLLIKENNLLKSSFKTINKLESKNILNTVMAEQLLANHDLLILNKNYEITRVHTPNISENEIKNIIDFWKNII